MIFQNLYPCLFYLVAYNSYDCIASGKQKTVNVTDKKMQGQNQKQKCRVLKTTLAKKFPWLAWTSSTELKCRLFVENIHSKLKLEK